MEYEGCGLAILVTFSCLLCFAVGLGVGLTANHRDSAVIKEVSISNSNIGKYDYTTNQFDFVSDSVYQVGDTIKITRY